MDISISNAYINVRLKRKDTLGETVREMVLGAVGYMLASDADILVSHVEAAQYMHVLFSIVVVRSIEELAFYNVCKKMLDGQRTEKSKAV